MKKNSRIEKALANEAKVIDAIKGGAHTSAEISKSARMPTGLVVCALDRLTASGKTKKVGKARGQRIFLTATGHRATETVPTPDVIISPVGPAKLFADVGATLAAGLEAGLSGNPGRPETMPLALYEQLMVQRTHARLRVQLVDTFIANYND